MPINGRGVRKIQNQRRADRRWTYQCDAHVALLQRQFIAQGLSKAEHGRFAGRVRGKLRKRTQRVDAGQGDETPTPTRHHARQRGQADMNRPQVVGCHLCVEIGRWCGLKKAGTQNAGRVDDRG